MISSSVITTAESAKGSLVIPASQCCGTALRSSGFLLASVFSFSPPPLSFCSPRPASFAAAARSSTNLRPRPIAEVAASLVVSECTLMACAIEMDEVPYSFVLIPNRSFEETVLTFYVRVL